MIGTDKIIAVITARGGSKRLPGKNILPLSGKPMIAWSIKAGLESKYVDRLIVSTDDAEIAAVLLDADLCIKDISVPAQKIFQINKTDIGRALSEIKSSFIFADLFLYIQDVFKGKDPKETEINTDDGRSYLPKVKFYLSI